MIDDTSDALAGDDFRPADFRSPEPGDAAISRDFVERTAALVREDLARIRAEAARVEEHRLPADLLGAYRVPEPSPGFVEATLLRVRSERELDDAGLQRLLARYGAPAVTPDFVQRTLDALRVEAPPPARLRAVPGPRPAGERATRWAWAAAAAAFVTLGATILWPDGGSRPAESGPFAAVPVVTSSQEYTPTVLGTGLSRWRDETDGLRFEPTDGLLQLATGQEDRVE